MDRGGTSIRVKAFDGRGRLLHTYTGTSIDVPDLPDFFKTLFMRWKIEPTHLVMGSRGVWAAPGRREMLKQIRPLAAHVTVLSDVVTAWLSAFGRNGRHGILLLSGTGSVAYGRNHNGHARLVGGLGPAIGDEGSGFWIGDQWKRARRPLTPAIVRRTAAQAPQVRDAARRGDHRARQILREAQTHLVQLLITLERQLKWKGPLPVAFAGSVLLDSTFRRGVLQRLKETGLAYRVVKPTCDAATAAARTVLDDHGHR